LRIGRRSGSTSKNGGADRAQKEFVHEYICLYAALPL
jgi:hypothetical protein